MILTPFLPLTAPNSLTPANAPILVLVMFTSPLELVNVAPEMVLMPTAPALVLVMLIPLAPLMLE